MAFLSHITPPQANQGFPLDLRMLDTGISCGGSNVPQIY